MNIKIVNVKEFAQKLGLKVLYEGRGEVELSDVSVSRPGLQLAGFYEQFANRRVQVIGNAESEFLKSLPEKAKESAINQLFSKNIACLIIARGLDIGEELASYAREYFCPVFLSEKVTTILVHDLTIYLSEELASSERVHGVLMDVYGVGVLITGKAGIGKSETALELICRGHRLIADDTVVIRQNGSVLMGSSPEKIRYYMEVRGVGIINVKTMYGAAAVRPEKQIDIIIELAEWTENLEYDRLGTDNRRVDILDVSLPKFIVPIRPGRNIPVIIEAAAKKYRLEEQLGMSGAEELIKNAFEVKQ